jgi:hypothetical protein
MCLRPIVRPPFASASASVVAAMRGDRDFERQDRFDGPAEGELDRTAHLTGIDARRHDRAEGANVPEIAAHPAGEIARRRCVLRTFLEIFGLGRNRRHSGPGAPVLVVEGCSLAHVDLVAGHVRSRQGDVVADLTLWADVGDEPPIGLRVEPRQVARVRIAVRIAVGHVEIEHELMPPRDTRCPVRRH